MCGDPACASCGNPATARAEAAAEALIDQLADLKLTPEEYGIVATAGALAVRLSREAVKRYRDEQAFLAEEERSYGTEGETVPGWADQG